MAENCVVKTSILIRQIAKFFKSSNLKKNISLNGHNIVISSFMNLICRIKQSTSNEFTKQNINFTIQQKSALFARLTFNITIKILWPAIQHIPLPATRLHNLSKIVPFTCFYHLFSPFLSWCRLLCVFYLFFC